MGQSSGEASPSREADALRKKDFTKEEKGREQFKRARRLEFQMEAALIVLAPDPGTCTPACGAPASPSCLPFPFSPPVALRVRGVWGFPLYRLVPLESGLGQLLTPLGVILANPLKERLYRGAVSVALLQSQATGASQKIN